MYIFIFEGGEVIVRPTCQPEDLESCDADILSIIDIENPERPLDYFDGKWNPLPTEIIG